MLRPHTNNGSGKSHSLRCGVEVCSVPSARGDAKGVPSGIRNALNLIMGKLFRKRSAPQECLNLRQPFGRRLTSNAGA